MMTSRALIRTQTILAFTGVVLASAGAYLSWRAADHHGLALALLIVASALASIVLTRVLTRTRLDHSA
jgi:zinc transporter ZupT